MKTMCLLSVLLLLLVGCNTATSQVDVSDSQIPITPFSPTPTILQTQENYVENEDNSDKNDFEHMILLGIYEEDADPDALVTKASIAKVICRLLECEDSAKSINTTKYDDVVDHWAIGYISVVDELGYIDSDDDTFFYPDNPLTVGEVREIFVDVYNYPDKTYIDSLLLEGYNISEEYITFSDLSVMLERLIELDIYNSDT